MYETIEKTNSQADKHQPAAAPTTGANQNTSPASVNQKRQHPARKIPAAIKKIVRTTARAIKRVVKKKKPGVALWVAIGRALNRGEAQLRNTEAHRSYGVQFTIQVAVQSRIHVRRAYYCAAMASLFSAEHVARLAVAQLPWRVMREVMAFVGNDEHRLAMVMQRIPKNDKPAGRRALMLWLLQRLQQRVPLVEGQCYARVDAHGNIHGRLMTMERAKAIAKGQKVMKVVPATA